VSPSRTLTPRASRVLQAFAKKAGRGINRFGMIRQGDRILIGLSGGKDSLALCVALAERKRWVPIDYDLAAVLVNWHEYPVGPAELEAVRLFLEELGIPLEVIDASIYPERHQKPFSCYICSRNRKRILFQEAARRGITKVALGHHLDDIVETTLLNLFFRGEFATMMPVQEFFHGRLHIIRPLCEVEERDIQRLDRHYALPVVHISCPRKDLNQRIILKEILKSLKRVSRQVKENIYRAPWHINSSYLPSGLPTPE
jgi:tRNA 2-thiocytidine biosynthesis protein TtcA